MIFGNTSAPSRILCGLALAILLSTPAAAQHVVDGLITFSNAGNLRWDLADSTLFNDYLGGALNDLDTDPGPGWNPVFPNADWQPDPGTVADGDTDDVSVITHPNVDPCDNCNAQRVFEQTCYRGAIDPAGADWTAGWTVSGQTTSIKPAGWETRPFKILSGVQPVSAITFDADTIYAFIGKVTIPAGASLTIEPGTLCIGENASSGYLVIDRGAQIFANGTPANPIVMTTDLEPPIVGGWGGLVIHGRAVANCADCLGGASCISEGGAGEFCGTDDCDNSGSMQYVIVGYAGVEISTDNELNAFTFNGVGANGTFRYLQAHQGSDDLFEWFGGKMNARYLVGTGGDDDGVDWQMGFRGTVQNVVVQRYPGNPLADKCIEADNNENGFDAPCRSNPLIANATFIGTNGAGNDQYGVHFRRGTDVQFFNSIIAYQNNRAVRVSDNATLARGLGTRPGAFCGPATGAPQIAAASAHGIEVRTFPNPVVQGTRFSFSLPQGGRTRLDIYDVSGRRVANVVDGQLTAGPHDIAWTPGSNLVAGTYFYRLENASAPAMGKLVLVR
jgi:hypothetical protein